MLGFEEKKEDLAEKPADPIVAEYVDERQSTQDFKDFQEQQNSFGGVDSNDPLISSAIQNVLNAGNAIRKAKDKADKILGSDFFEGKIKDHYSNVDVESKLRDTCIKLFNELMILSPQADIIHANCRLIKELLDKKTK